MAFRQKLWTASCVTTPEAAEKLSSALDDALALTVLAPPRILRAEIQAIYDHPPDAAALTARLTVIATLHDLPVPKLVTAEVPSLDWLQKVAEDFPPLPIARWTIHGAQHADKVSNRRYALQIDATSAFGTGEHPTTRGCLMMLDWLLKRRSPMNILDMGCGSGILAMGALKSRPGKAVAVDMDPLSVEIAHNNARMNGLEYRIHTGISFGYRSPLVGRNAPYDLILANIFAGPLSQMAKNLWACLEPGGHTILSGLLTIQANRVIAAHRLQGLALVKHMRLGEWSVLALRRRPGAQ